MCFKCINRRQVLAGSLAIGSNLLSKLDQASAQQYILLCSWAGTNVVGQGLAPATSFAIGQVQSVTQAIGFRVPLQVFMGGVPNASATVLNGMPAIIYNPGFLGNLFQCNRAAGMTVLAHEVGHHANLDTTWAGQYKHPWTRELAADWVSGLAMRRLGANLDDTISGIQCSMGPFSPGTIDHPDSQNRLRAIVQGWQTG